MVEFLSEAWWSRMVALAGEIEAPLRDGEIEIQVTGGPSGSTRATMVIEEERISSVADGSADDARVTLKLTWETARDLMSGDLDPSAAFMTGALKTEGATGPLLALLAAARTPSGRSARAALEAETSGI